MGWFKEFLFIYYGNGGLHQEEEIQEQQSEADKDMKEYDEDDYGNDWKED